jgi:hypothetical protein
MGLHLTGIVEGDSAKAGMFGNVLCGIAGWIRSLVFGRVIFSLYVEC